MRIHDVCELCDESLLGNDGEAITYCYLCSQQKAREDKSVSATNSDVGEMKRNMN
ncbi:MAG: hypothetical protein AABY26_03630 [Nanoarchaeota archaeon]